MALKDTGNNRGHDGLDFKKTKKALTTIKVEKVTNNSKTTLST